ncbi:MAG: SDR family oxidoreductase [Dehalococcoidales bacterium]|nr:SDR family oxidoreductase [Dehalococcoidales bacterium]
MEIFKEATTNTQKMFDISGRKALVTGAGRGIGKVLALALAEAGCDISIVEIDMKNAAAVVEEIREMGRKAFAFEADVTKKDSLRKAFEGTQKEFGRLDICLNNAGVCIHQSAEDTSEKDLNHVVDINLKGVFFCCQEASRIMIPQKKGTIINIASMSGTIANVPQKQAHYNASKAGVIMLTKSLAVEWAPYGVRVNSISPGYIRTEMTLMGGQMFPAWESLTPMGRLGEASELRGLVIYLASDASSFMTGSDIIIDGGYTAR